MSNLTFIAKEFKRMADPINKDSNRVKYVCYAQARTIPFELENWMATNPRDQKMTTTVAKTILDSIEQGNAFHELNRGILISAEDVSFDTKSCEVSLELVNNDIHGNIDGGHTLKAIYDAQRKGTISDDVYVFIEIFTGIDSPVDLAAARNTSVQVDLKSIEELQNSFEVIKQIVAGLPFENRVAYKMNQHYGSDFTSIDVREIITVLNMFNQSLYPLKDVNGGLNESQPIQSYTGKETSLKKFLNLGKENREKTLQYMSPIVEDIFDLANTIETDFDKKAKEAGKAYGRKKYSKFSDGKVVGKSLYNEDDLYYIVPKGIIYPILGAFRALIEVDTFTNTYSWKVHPQKVWDSIGSKLVTIVLEEKEDNPEYLGKSANLWSNLFKEVFIYSRIS